MVAAFNAWRHGPDSSSAAFRKIAARSSKSRSRHPGPAARAASTAASASSPVALRMVPSTSFLACGWTTSMAWPADPPDATGPVLLACHGWTDSAAVFDPLVHTLRRRWTVIAPDAPGHGGTPLRDGDYVIADHAVAVLAVLEAMPRIPGGGG